MKTNVGKQKTTWAIFPHLMMKTIEVRPIENIESYDIDGIPMESHRLGNQPQASSLTSLCLSFLFCTIPMGRL